MENTSQAKKINWGMIILLVILVPILILGYKYVSKKMDGNDNEHQNTSISSAPQNNTANEAPAQYSNFPLFGVWYYNDNGTGPKYAYDKYNFTAPQMINGLLKGQLTMTMEWMQTVKTLNFEVISDGKLRISDSNNDYSPYEMEYIYNASSQTLEISDEGYRLTYTRNVPANSHTTQSNANNSSSGNTNQHTTANTTNLIKAAERIADILWKMTTTENGATFHYTRKFSMPRLENGKVVGEYVRTYKQVGNYCTLETNYKYQMLSDNQYSWEIVSAACDGKAENTDVGKTGTHIFELSNGGKTLLQWSAGKDRASASIWTRN